MKIFVKPKSGMTVVKPETAQHLSAEGEHVIQSSYWLRRIADGDVILIEEKEKEQTQTKLESPKSKKSE